jgi:hypothetical protein
MPTFYQPLSMLKVKKFFSLKRRKDPDSNKFCFEDPHSVETRKALLYFDRKFRLMLILAVIYGLFFVNFIDIVTMGSAVSIYHLWLFALYFAPFILMTWIFPRNWALTLGLGLMASLMNDVFYGLIRASFWNLAFPLWQYYTWWLVPSDHYLFSANIGFAVFPVYSWMMAVSIYGRVAVVVALFWIWKRQFRQRCLSAEEISREVVENQQVMA